MSNEPTTKEILEAIDDFSGTVDKNFKKVDERFNKIEATIVTKNYLDEKLSDLRGDLVVLMRKEDTKVKTLAEILHKHKVISNDELKQVLSMEPFSQMFIK